MNAVTRTPLSSNTIASTRVGGIRVLRCPATSAELLGEGFVPQRPIEGFTTPAWFNKLALCARDNKGPVVVTGTAGTGKDTAAKMLAAMTGRPFYKIGLSESTDLSTALIEMSIEGGDTVKRLGPLAKAAKGLTIQRGGKEMTIPAVILISDFDRANPRTLETFRNAFEEGGWFAMPDGSALEVTAGTTFVLTSNSGLDGDGGAGMIAEAFDASIGDRLRWIGAPPPSSDWMETLISNRFPQLKKKLIKKLVKATMAMKALSEQLMLPMPVSIRHTLRWAADIITCMDDGLEEGEAAKIALGLSVESTLTEENRNALWGSIDSIFESDIPRGEGVPNPVDFGSPS